ncbi:DUF6384 family protein [Bythopirellula goksoeyrii]|uniref:Uncharacterized protein n=1 Tax=Bythopirellula goksoeyrii TaxID=1400387 RepID=A0A5B9QLP1_9BACT|nr:DUF6384 family protein [Bythopirellula goksoeyrii]QEG35061.1 hypothetical protein Pr1d_23520 [Bythopirellula goksoeyrii]
MPQIQIAQPPAQQQDPPVEKTEEIGTTEPKQLSLEELLRIMDVATTLRKEHDVVEEQLNLDQIKVRLRERLLEAAKVTGERVTAEQIDTAIENYYDKLHTFEEPKWSFSVLMAQIYVRRATIIKWAIGIGAIVALLWTLLIAVMLPVERPLLAAETKTGRCARPAFGTRSLAACQAVATLQGQRAT